MSGQSVRWRQRAIIVVARTRNDLYGAKGLRLASQPGPAPSGRVPCSCSRVARLRVNGAVVPTLVGAVDCHLCEGSGFREPIRGLDRAGEDTDEAGRVYDPYTLGADRAEKTKVVLQSPERAKDSEPDDRLPFERRPRIYLVFDRLMDALRIRDEEAWGAFTAAHVEKRWDVDGRPELSFRAGLAVMAGLTFLERRFPVPVRLPAGLVQRVDELEREALTAEHRGGGLSLGETARRLGVSRRAVRRAERRMEGAA